MNAFGIDFSFQSALFQITLLLASAGLLATLAAYFKQPLFIGYLAMGLIAGPLGLHWLHEGSVVNLLSSMGVSLLLFLVGIRLNLELLEKIGRALISIGMLQVIVTGVMGYFLALALGSSSIASFYFAVCLTFSSTILGVKLLSDKRELQTIHGQLSVGILIIQDLVAILVLLLISFMNRSDGTHFLSFDFVVIFFKIVLAMVLIAALMRYVLKTWTRKLAISKELLMLFALTWALIGASLGQILGFGQEIGAFVAGITLASTPYREAIGARLTGMRDFLLPFFFFELGAELKFTAFQTHFFSLILFFCFVMLLKPIIIAYLVGKFGYKKRTSFFTALCLAEMSEFSLIVASVGLSYKHLSEDEYSLITILVVATIALSSYLFNSSQRLYTRYAESLSIFEKPLKNVHHDYKYEVVHDVILMGAGRFGAKLVKSLKKRNASLAVVDFDPHALDEMKGKADHIYYGDVEDVDFLETLPFEGCEWVISTVPYLHINQILLDYLRDVRYSGKIAIVAYHAWDAEQLKEAGVDLILEPFHDSAEAFLPRFYTHEG